MAKPEYFNEYDRSISFKRCKNEAERRAAKAKLEEIRKRLNKAMAEAKPIPATV